MLGAAWLLLIAILFLIMNQLHILLSATKCFVKRQAVWFSMNSEHCINKHWYLPLSALLKHQDPLPDPINLGNIEMKMYEEIQP